MKQGNTGLYRPKGLGCEITDQNDLTHVSLTVLILINLDSDPGWCWKPSPTATLPADSFYWTACGTRGEVSEDVVRTKKTSIDLSLGFGWLYRAVLGSVLWTIVGL